MSAMFKYVDDIKTTPEKWAMPPLPSPYGYEQINAMSDRLFRNCVNGGTVTRDAAFQGTAFGQGSYSVGATISVASVDPASNAAVIPVNARYLMGFLGGTLVEPSPSCEYVIVNASDAKVMNYVWPSVDVVSFAGQASTVTNSVSHELIERAFKVLRSTQEHLVGYEKYSSPNWDGEGADPILKETVVAARSIMHGLPNYFGDPDAAPAADGTIGLEWVPECGPLQKLFIDIGPRTTWRAYWRLGNGEIGEAEGDASTDLAGTFQSLFDKLR